VNGVQASRKLLPPGTIHRHEAQSLCRLRRHGVEGGHLLCTRKRAERRESQPGTSTLSRGFHICQLKHSGLAIGGGLW